MSFFKKEQEELSLLIDIGNGSITGALVLFRKKEKPLFLYSTKVPFTIRDKPSADKLLDEMGLLLESLLSNIIENTSSTKYLETNKKSIERAMLAFSSPWFFSKTKHLNLSNDVPFIISKDFIKDITKKEEELFQEEINKREDFLGDMADGFELVENSIVHAKINGYEIGEIIGKKTKNFDAYLCLSVMSKSVINKISNLLLKHAHISREKTLIHTFPLISFSAVRDIFSGTSDFIIMDITGEVTDMTLVQGNIIRQSVSMPSGRNFVIRQIARTLNMTPEVSESTLRLYFAQKLDPESLLKVEQVLINVEKEWSIYFENALSEFGPIDTLPGTLYMTTDEDVSLLYMNFLKLEKTDGTALFRKNLNLIHVGHEVTKQFFDTKTSETNEFIALLAIFYNKIIWNI